MDSAPPRCSHWRRNPLPRAGSDQSMYDATTISRDERGWLNVKFRECVNDQVAAAVRRKVIWLMLLDAIGLDSRDAV